ncbi:hypothetical protein CYLTODRAFT_426591 [Cylindrobasidium torrendii FP15055 ss-10]|uniref:C2H2-type domain-containing protein n=1 Tax=Cylindrobasidium torrendii FP15055 ss-10 TaxID=1314674 RepID=A0A0D7AY96_9AGAR|nr:hypothetical protein CYLTODRAFT_426591 [Cylindrobasidium torrendii FP15055 ss-10]
MIPSSGMDDSFKSLLSLSSVAATAQPIPIHKPDGYPDASQDSYGAKSQRRLSSTTQTRRRLSDARDAVTRPSPASLSLSSLTLSTPSPPPPSMGIENPELAGLAKPVIIPKNGKKRGVDHKCESCSKVYRHPSCLIKHRWEHTPHWRESSKYVLSKHQQVQLLEAAAILSHLSPSTTSLPEDRSLWPSFLSGGSLPAQAAPTASSVPIPQGPRMHDYHLPAASAATQVRPGLLAVSVPEHYDTSQSVYDESDEEMDVYEDENQYHGGGFGARSRKQQVKEEEEEWDELDMDMD